MPLFIYDFTLLSSPSFSPLPLPKKKKRKKAFQAMAKSVGMVLSLFCLLLSVAVSDLTRIEHSLKSDGSLAILVVGDWGRKGAYNQSLVAEQVNLFF
jgi:hypothetical protein